MSSVATIIAQARTKSKSTSSSYPDADAIIDLNSVYHECENEISTYLWEWYFNQISYSDCVVNQWQYTLPAAVTSVHDWFKNLRKVSVKYKNDSARITEYVTESKQVTLYSAYEDLAVWMDLKFYNQQWYLIHEDTVATKISSQVFTLTTWYALTTYDVLRISWVTNEYYPAFETTLSNFDYDEQYYKDNRLTKRPMYRFYNDSVMIYPVPTEYVANWIKLEWIYNLPDLTTSSTEADIKIPKQYHDVLIYWLRRKAYEHREMFNEAWAAYAMYIQLREQMINKMDWRDRSPLEERLPNLYHLEA